MTKRITVSLTDEFYTLLADYQQSHDLPSLSAALLELAEVGAVQLFHAPPALRGAWGGDRKSADYLAEIQDRLEHEEVKRLGLPPLE